jgi:uncharacterized protein YegP (UPF0339 family)
VAGKFVITKTKNDGYHFNLKAGNGEVILSSQTYASKTSAEAGIASVKVNAIIDEHFERSEDKSGHPRFNLKASNGQVIGVSESYNSKAGRDNGIESVKKNAPDAKTVDESEE